jgi:stearoyl-CoA desaturase (Delta-9 desaturase)
MSYPRPTLQQAVTNARRAAERLERWVASSTIIVPTLATVVAVTGAASGIMRPSPGELGRTTAFCLGTLLGVSAGFHRLFTHRSFEAHVVVRALLGILGSMAAQGPLLFWVTAHREHHQRSDALGDPHSPYVRAQERLTTLRGFWHAHLGWMMQHESTAWSTYAPDILRDQTAFFVSRWYVIWVLMGLVLPGVIAGLWHRSLLHAVLGVLWGGLVRTFLVHHATWSVNSLGHMIGRRAFATPDRSRNNALVALVTLGEGWHNNHHAFPSSARHGLTRWEIDPSYAVIRLLACMGLARDVKLPHPQHMARSRLAPDSTAGAPPTLTTGDDGL